MMFGAHLYLIVNRGNMKLTKEEQQLFESLSGLFFPFMSVARNRGLKFNNDIEELDWCFEIYNNTFYPKLTMFNFSMYIWKNYGLITMVRYILK